MTISELLEVCERAKGFPKNFDKPVDWLNFRRLLGPDEIRLLLEEHAALGAALSLRTEEETQHSPAGIAHRATDAVLSALVMPDPGAPLGHFVEDGTRERIHAKAVTHE